MNLFKNLFSILFVISFATIAGCSSPKTKYFILDDAPASTITKYRSCNRIIAIDKVTVANYLDKPNIITRIKPNELLKAEFYRWSEPLDNNIQRVLQQNLSRQLKSDTLLTYPWLGKPAIDYRIEIAVNQFDVDNSGNSVLKVSWNIYDDKKVLIKSKKATYNANASDPANYLDIVRTMNKNITLLGNDLAGQLSGFCYKNK